MELNGRSQVIVSKKTFLFFNDTGVWTLGLTLEPLCQSHLMMSHVSCGCLFIYLPPYRVESPNSPVSGALDREELKGSQPKSATYLTSQTSTSRRAVCHHKSPLYLWEENSILQPTDQSALLPALSPTARGHDSVVKHLPRCARLWVPSLVPQTNK
jgi:hypothetical protein